MTLLRACLLVFPILPVIGEEIRDIRFRGTWVARIEELPVMVLTLEPIGERIRGTLRRPREIRIVQENKVDWISPEQVEVNVRGRITRRGFARIRIGGEEVMATLRDRREDDEIVMRLPDTRASFGFVKQRDRNEPLQIARRLPAPERVGEIRQLRQLVQSLAHLERQVRANPKDPRTDSMTEEHGVQLRRIFDRYGWLPYSLVGYRTATDFWSLVQQQPVALQERMLPAMERAVAGGEASAREYAFLYDRVQVRRGRQQRWGTQVECVDGKPVMHELEDDPAVNERRKALGLPSLKDYLRSKELVEHCRGRLAAGSAQ